MYNATNYDYKMLIIVDSANKAKTIKSIFKNICYRNVDVITTNGNIITILDGKYAFNSGISVNNDFKINFGVIEEKNKVVNFINNKANTADKVILMTNNDIEGELLAWSIITLCKLPKEKCCRAILTEITQKSLLYAIENTSCIDNNLVNAGIAKMVFDKLFGYGLSPVCKKYLGVKSIGRSQALGLKLLSDKEYEINNFIPEVYFDLYLNFTKNETEYSAKYVGYKEEITQKLTKQEDVDAIVSNCKKSQFIVNNVTTKKCKKMPKAPFCTTTFLQEATSKLGISTKDAIRHAKKLFEGVSVSGKLRSLITYYITESTEIKNEFMHELKQVITASYGEGSYSYTAKTKDNKNYISRSEAIRIVDLKITPEVLAASIDDEIAIKIYTLIWQRTLSAVMTPAIVTNNVYSITSNGHMFEFSTETITSAGYLAVNSDNTERVDPKLLKLDELIDNTNIYYKKKFTQPAPRYTEASFISVLQHYGVNNPSTQIFILNSVLDSKLEYSTLKEGQLIQTNKGLQLSKYCDRALFNVVNIKYLKELENNIEKIACGKANIVDCTKNLYENLSFVTSGIIETGIASDIPEIICPGCGNTMIVRRNRFGRLFYGCSTYPECLHTEALYK